MNCRKNTRYPHGILRVSTGKGYPPDIHLTSTRVFPILGIYVSFAALQQEILVNLCFLHP